MATGPEILGSKSAAKSSPGSARLSCLRPVVGRHPRLLILGSMPGVASLQARQYYGHPRNAFWPIMGELFGVDPELPYQERLARLRAKGIALWDVLASCERPGSLDSNIRQPEANNVAGLLKRHRSIRRVYFNGGTAARLYRRLLLAEVGMLAPYAVHAALPSTSPAYTLPFAEKLKAWSAIAESSA